MLEYKNIKIRWLGHDSFLIQTNKSTGNNEITIYLDPYEISRKDFPKADIVITSHEHFDHCHPDSINLISASSTILVGPPITHDTLRNKVKTKKEIISLSPNETINIKGIKISAIPAYNTHRFRAPGKPFHPKDSGHIGTILHLGEITIYHSGDTDKITEMENLRPTIALLPVSGTYVMDAQECAEAVKIINPEIVIPMHVGRGIGSLDARFELRDLLPSYRVEILDLEE
ncbi:MAG: MBL fold metallo-hydrolase [Candidatus Lokiarchaeota archaeon]|nr:MBL fold metallo-hydrolase [Candidatus Harpocratesius repetitus]